MKKFFRYPFLVVGAIAIITVFFSFQLPRAELDNNNMRFVPSDDPALALSRSIDETFGSSLFVLVALERPWGTVFDGPFLNRVREYVERAGEIGAVSEISSLVNADYITSRGDAIVVEKLVGEDFSGTPAEVEELKRRVLSWDMYDRSLVSRDFSATQILATLSISQENAGKKESVESFVQIRDIAREMFDGYATVYVTGLPVISATINEAVQADLRLLIPLVIAVVLAVLFLSFRKADGVILPLLTVIVAAIWAIGAMPLFGVKLSIISTVLPVILVAVGSAYGIHVMTHYASMNPERAPDREAHRELVFEMLRNVAKPVFLAALTTFTGFVSFCFTRVVPIREFGFFASFGVLASFAVALTLIPALMLIRGPEKKAAAKNAAAKNAGGEGGDIPDAALPELALALASVSRKKRTVLFLTAAVFLVSLYGLSKVVIDNVMVEYFRHDTDIYRSDLFIREKFGGSKVISVVAEADSPEILLMPEALRALDGLSDLAARRVPEIGKVMGFTALVKRVNQVFNAGEDPRGLAPRGADNDNNAEFSLFDGGADGGPDSAGFGFGAFGFDGGEPAGGDLAEPAETSENRHGRVYTEADLFSLLERAALEPEQDARALVRNLERLVNWEGAGYYEIPHDPARYGKRSEEDLRSLVSNYLVLLSGSIGSWANDPLEPTAVKSTVQLRTTGQRDTDHAVAEIRKYIAAEFPENVRAVIGGSALVEGSLNGLVVNAQLVSVIISLIMVFVIIALSNRSLPAGIVGIVPLSVSILINFAVMGFAGIKLSLGTAMVASVSVGIGIDYTIHYLEAYKREYRATGGSGNFLHRSFAVSGKAIIINALSVGAGFAVLALSRFNILADLGLLVALTMITSALASLTVIPVLLQVLKPKFVERDYGRNA